MQIGISYMSLTIELTPELEKQLARQAEKRGISVNTYAVDLLQRAAENFIPGAESSRPPLEVLEAIEQLRKFGKSRGLTPGGMTIQELRHEARP
jgi:hypothetical protein